MRCAPCWKLSRTTRSKPAPEKTEMMGSVRSDSRWRTLPMAPAYSRTTSCMRSQARPCAYSAAMKAPCIPRMR